MANITTLTNIRAQASYLGDGVWPVLDAVLNGLPPGVKNADNLSLYTAAALHTIVAVTTTVGAYPLALIAVSQGTACCVHVYAADDATVGTTDSLFSVLVSGTAGEISTGLYLGSGAYRLGATSGSGIGIAAPATTVGTGAVASDPVVYLLYVAS